MKNKKQKDYYGIIYVITNKANNKKYIGQTINTFKQRYRNGLYKDASNPHLKNAIKKYGEHSFIVNECLIKCYSKEELDRMEQVFITTFRTFDPNYGYNKNYGGDSKIPTQEFRQKMSEITRGEKNGMYGKKHTEESKRKMSENTKGKLAGENSPHWGKPKSEETRKKISLSRKGKYTGADNHMYGKTLSEENRRKIAESNRRRSGANSSVAKKVKCVNTDEVFVSATEAGKHFGLKGDYVARVARGERNYVKHPTSGEKLLFIYI